MEGPVIAVAVLVVSAIVLWALFSGSSSKSTKHHTPRSESNTQHVGRIKHTLNTLETLYGKGTKEFKEAVNRQRGYRTAMIASFRRNGMSESDITKKDHKYFGTFPT
jgi:hypothetical protein